ncbi:laminin subunit alpha-1 [Galleria mellonella]|uniref:Laminin subunit alpha-1 n=1 Tax=Galleria mellonella TaxID=7137 RepID=A0ABM3MZQ9_GALME|nr:laminin subunit alpha-1 [Galleria mellonella]
MWRRWLVMALLVAVAAGKGKKHRHQKPGRALLDRLASTSEGEVVAIGDETSGLLPAPLDVAPYSAITANATCGDTGTEEFCRDTPGKRGVVCDVCEGIDGSPSRRHPPSHAVDGSPTTWWQSPTQAAGEEFSHVELVATLPDKMELLHVIIKSGPSPRPLAWSLEVSTSEGGDDWQMIRAFGDKEHCRRLWDLRPERRRRKARGAKRSNRFDKPTCSTQFVSPRPLENGEMHVGIGEGVWARRVRVSFRSAHPAPAHRRYYTVRALTLAARCLCHGHATHCNVDAQGAKCSCEHDTCGAQCERCCSGGTWSAGVPCGLQPDCTCGERGACTYDDTGAIVCVNCTENRAGPLCDRCLVGYYNALPDGPCLPCECDPEGSKGTCKWNRKHRQALCDCRPGFSGPHCDACKDSSAVFPACLPITTTAVPKCKCDPRGIVDPTRVCDEVCECKKNVVGERCDTCASGHYGLSAELASGCRPCYCSHITDSCVAAEPSDPLPPVVLPLGDAWLVSDVEGNQTLQASIDEQGKPYLISYEVEGWESFYWATDSWNGEQLSMYGGEIHATLNLGIVRGDTGGNPTVGPDIILIGADGTKLTSANTSYETAGQLEISVPLEEDAWYAAGEEWTASRAQLMDVLRDVRRLLLRAHLHLDQDEVRLEGAEVRGAARGSRAAGEACACPRGYGGAHCSRCAWGHARLLHAPHATPRFECVPCACNHHAHCDTVDGPCGPCQHNTTGPHCERCLPGHYGNPVQGACKPCACPLYIPSNNFSPNCVLASASGDEYVCTQCPDGYTGEHCEHCDAGHWGAPTEPGGACRPCECGGAPCRADTGECLVCPPHTEGARCDTCEEGYWFGPSGGMGASVGSGACVACACGAGALAAACDARSGQCACRHGWAGRACDVCAPGHGGIEEGCPPCRCGVAAIHSACDGKSGACVCAPGAAPPSCDTCLPEYYDLNTTGCSGCNCSSLGAESNVCDIRTGQCRCKPHVTGRACDTCEVGYWGLQQGGCRRCECGAGAAACDPVTGMCACASGVGGAQCDHCLPGYYGFRPAGCLPCPTCTDGKVCSPDTGQCVCPPRSRGPGCRQCAPGYWSKQNGCQPCRCGAGAIFNMCDPVSGQCKCRLGWTGVGCDRCATGHYGPRCRPCDCSPVGTLHCENGTCGCDEHGRCNCKENVVGDKCDKCLDGTFGLSAHNPVGCTACFCFGRAAHCSQAALTRSALHVAVPQHVTLLRGEDQITTMDQNSPLAIHTHSPDATISLPWPPVPVYVELDKRFLGDRVTSYGGALRFTVEEEGGEELPLETRRRFPLVLLYSKDIVLEQFERVPAKNGTHSVRLYESLWRVRDRGGVASRSALMVVLGKLDRILLRVTTRVPTARDNVHALLLNVSMDTAIPGLSRSEPALGVERCDCTSGFASDSCQRPARGYWLPPIRQNIHLRDGTIVITLDGQAQPCNCNGRATACDPVTGDCLNCTGGTGGARCAECAAGYYGAAPACRPCPCAPGASGCRLIAGRLQCLCKPGYAGAECERCAAGWRRVGDACAACACDPRGALSARCDARGTCRCRPPAAGPTCSLCAAPRTYMGHDGCTPCDNCTQTLLDAAEDLTRDLRARANPTELSRIPKPFPALLEFAHNSSKLVDELKNLRTDMTQMQYIENSIANLESEEHLVFTEAHQLKEEAFRIQNYSQSMNVESMNALDEVLKQRRQISEQVARLNEFSKGERHLSAHKALKEARKLLRQINDIKLIDYIGSVNDVFNTAHLQSASVQQNNRLIDDMYKRVRTLQNALMEWDRKGEDLTRLADTVWTAGEVVTAVGTRVLPRLATVRDIGLRCRLMLEDITSLSAKNLTDEIASAILRSQAVAIKFPSLTAELETLTAAAEEKEGILYNLTPVYRQKYLENAERHVAMLGEKAKEYKRLFAGTRAAASPGMSAARAWSAVAAAVREAAAAANSALAAAAAAASMARGPDPVLRAAAAGIRSSDGLRKKGAAVLAKADELRTQLDRLIHEADLVSVTLRGLGWQEQELEIMPQANVAATLAESGRQADRVFATTRALYDEAAELRRRVQYQMRRQLVELQRHGDTALGAAQEHVSQIRGNMAREVEVVAALEGAAAARGREQAERGAALSPALRSLAARVARAHHAAASIAVSVSSAASGTCARAFLREAPSAAAWRLALAVSFERHVQPGTLLYVLDDGHDDNAHGNEKYLHLSVEDKRLHVRWDLGDGPGYLRHPQELQPAQDDADHATYKIELDRVWNTVHLRVERLGAGVVSASNSSGPGAVTLQASRVWLGAPPPGKTGASDLPGISHLPGLPGCVHALYSDDKTIGLWNFVEQPKNAQCTGCTQRWFGGRVAGGGAAGGGAEAALAWFDGAGYAELRRASPRAPDRRHFSLAFTFRTRDRDALLFMAFDAANNRSVWVALQDCHVVFTVQYGGARLRIADGGRHCDGRPAHVQAIRVFAANNLEKGSLRVNGEETLGSPSPPVQAAAALPDLTAAPYWLGGLPPRRPVPAPAPALLGCLGAVSVDREGYDLMDTPSRHGVEPSCGTRVLRSAVFEGNGFVELPWTALRRRGALGASFRARAADGLLLLLAPTADRTHYLALLMVNGELEVIAAAGKEELRLRTNGTKFDDRRLHTVRLLRAHKQLELWVDDEKLAQGPLSGSTFAARDNGFFVGGVDNDTANIPNVPTTGFTGTIADIIVDGQLVGVEGAVRWRGAGLGRADAEPRELAREPPRALQRPPAASGCSKSSSYTLEAGALKFGDSAWSHATLRLGAHSGQLAVTLQFRTFAPNGILLLAPGSKTKPKHYTVLMVREGKLKLIVRGRKRREFSLAAFVADGTWRTVSVRVSRARASLWGAGGAGGAAGGAAPSAARARRLYLGGLPAPPALPHLPAAMSRWARFVGCVRRVTVRGRARDVAREAALHAVGQCFPRVEPAAYFAGDAYATWSSSRTLWGEGGVLEVRLQFRTAEPNGVLFAIGDLILELKDGAVVLSRGDEVVEWRGAGSAAGGSLCDGAWHEAEARASGGALWLTPDGGPALRAARRAALPRRLACSLSLSSHARTAGPRCEPRARAARRPAYPPPARRSTSPACPPAARAPLSLAGLPGNSLSLYLTPDGGPALRAARRAALLADRPQPAARAPLYLAGLPGNSLSLSTAGPRCEPRAAPRCLPTGRSPPPARRSTSPACPPAARAPLYLAGLPGNSLSLYLSRRTAGPRCEPRAAPRCWPTGRSPPPARRSTSPACPVTLSLSISRRTAGPRCEPRAAPRCWPTGRSPPPARAPRYLAGLPGHALSLYLTPDGGPALRAARRAALLADRPQPAARAPLYLAGLPAARRAALLADRPQPAARAPLYLAGLPGNSLSLYLTPDGGPALRAARRAALLAYRPQPAARAPLYLAGLPGNSLSLYLTPDGGPALRAARRAALLADRPQPAARAPLYLAGLPGNSLSLSLSRRPAGPRCEPRAAPRCWPTGRSPPPARRSTSPACPVTLSLSLSHAGRRAQGDTGESTRENFKGCMREVTVGGQKRDWTEMEALHNVLLDSCPVQQKRSCTICIKLNNGNECQSQQRVVAILYQLRLAAELIWFYTFHAPLGG